MKQLKANRIYRIQVEYDFDTEDNVATYDKLMLQLDKWNKANNTWSLDQVAGACWGYFITVEGYNKQAVELTTNCFMSMVLKLNGAKVWE